MLKMIITEAVVSKGYNNDPAIRYFDIENSGQAANFRIGKRIYDGRAENKKVLTAVKICDFGNGERFL